jgi:hypothetical protein
MMATLSIYIKMMFSNANLYCDEAPSANYTMMKCNTDNKYINDLRY